MTGACGPGSPILRCLGPTRCSLLTGIAQGILAWLASAPSSPRIPRPGAIDRPWAGALIGPYPMAAPPWTVPRWGGAETCWILYLTSFPFYL